MIKTALLFVFVLFVGFSANAQTAWVGNYEFVESGGRTAGGTAIVVSHELVVEQANGKLTGNLAANGYQTSKDINFTAKASGTKLMIYFDSAGENNMFGDYEKGDLLLTLERKTVKGKTQILTRWGKYSPVYPKNEVSGRVYFKKT